jgi:hypothetical protein
MIKFVRLVLPITVLVVSACAAITEPGEERSSSRDSNNRDSPGAAQEATRFGAIAFSDSTQIWRFRWNVVEQQRAIDLALDDCGQADCRILITYGPALCGTFAMGRDGQTAAAAGRTPKESETAARAACNSVSEGCRVAPAQCNT